MSSPGIEATIEVSVNILQAKSKRKQAASNFAMNRCSSNPTSDFFYPLKKFTLKSFKKLRAVHKFRTMDSIMPLRVDQDLYLLGWPFSDSFVRLT